MTKDYSGKKLSRKANRWLLIVNLILLVCAVWLLIANVRHDEITPAIAMACVVVVTIYNGVVAFLRLIGKNT